MFLSELASADRVWSSHDHHCEERVSDEAIQESVEALRSLDCFGAPAMAGLGATSRRHIG
jgi:hypothetical protein